MDIANSVTGFWTNFGPTIRRYFRYQLCHNNYVSEFQKMQKQLKDRRDVIEAHLRTELMQRGKIENKEVRAWLDDAQREIAEEVIEVPICKGGCFTYICTSRKLDKKTQALCEEIFERGEKYTVGGEILVMDDHSIPYRAGVFQDTQTEVEYQKEKIKANLETQLRLSGKTALKKVKDWLEKASRQVTMKVEDLISQGECSSSTNIEEKIQELNQKIQELNQTLEEGKEFTKVGVSLVIDDHSKKGVTQGVERCIARDDGQHKILQLLRGDQVTRIAVCGMGGVGKTTIMKQVNNQLLKEPKVDKVIWVTVPENVRRKKPFDIIKLQKSIAGKLHLDLKNEDQDAMVLAELITNALLSTSLPSNTLQKGSCVLILDDVWEPFFLNEVLILDRDVNNRCKLVVTTRFQDVARAMDCEVIQVNPLQNKEAFALFLGEVGSAVQFHPTYKRDIEPFLDQILKKCNGLPLAIGVIAKVMKGKYDRYSWEIATKKLRKSKDIIECLKFSYDDHLEEHYKKCFLYCALYPEHHEILEEELIEFWIEEEFITDEKGSRHLMFSEGCDILKDLKDNWMLELVKTKYKGDWASMSKLVKSKYKKDRVTMHDLLREMAFQIIPPQYMVRAGMALEELPKEHEWRKDLSVVSLMNNNIREIPSSMSPPKCPMLTTLLLSNSHIRIISEAFFDQMLELKILDLSRNYKLRRLPSSVSKLKNLTTLLLENCVSLEVVPSLSNLGCLKKLDLYGTSIEELPQGLNMLINLKYLWLGGRLSEIPDGLLRNLSKLQYLGVDWGIALKWEEIGRLRMLQSLDGWFSTVDDVSLFVKSKRKFPHHYRIFVGSYNDDDYYNYNKTFSNAMKLIVCSHIDICKEPNWLPSDAQSFYIFDCKDVKSLNDISGFQDATNLQHCTVDECDGLEFVVSSSCLKLLQNLESLYLYYLGNLNAVFGEVEAVAKSAPMPVGTFSSLRKIKVEGCEKIKKLLPVRLLLYLQNLQTIKVRYCNQMEEIIWSEYEEEGEIALEKLTLPKLERLVLVGLLALKSIYSGSSTVLIFDSIKRIDIRGCSKIERVFWKGFNLFPTLEYLRLWGLGNLKSVYDEEALGLSAPCTTFFSLKTIDVYYCHELKKLFSFEWLPGYFQSLETIEVKYCDQMEELISSSSYEGKEALEEITLPNLQGLKLKKLPELKTIYSSSNVLICDSIKSLEISNCEKLKRIPLHLSSLDNGQPLSLKQIQVDTKECWESLEWDQSSAKDVLLSYVNFA